MADWTHFLQRDMWGAAKRPDGSWASNTGMVYRLDGSGVFDRGLFLIHNGESIHMYGPGRAAGVPIIAGLIMRDEIAAGRIEHKLAYCANMFSALQQFCHPPACWTDGRHHGGLPEGAVIQLDPGLDVSRLNLSRGGTIVARALQEYGAVDVDMGGGNALYGEGLWSQPGKTWAGLLPEDALTGLDIRHFRVLRIENVVPMGMRRTMEE